MNIGQASERTKLPPKTIRYYEEIALVAPERGPNGYRRYSDKDVHRLRFLQRARGLGFTIEECRLLLSLYEDQHRASSDVKALATDKIQEIDRKIKELNSLKRPWLRWRKIAMATTSPIARSLTILQAWLMCLCLLHRSPQNEYFCAACGSDCIGGTGSLVVCPARSTGNDRRGSG